MADEKLDLTSEDVPEEMNDASAGDIEGNDNVFDQVDDVNDSVDTAAEDDVAEEPLDMDEHSEDATEDDEQHDDHHPSLSSRILTWLVLLIAGAGLALWGGPKLAPNLPQWAAPAAKLLTPGGDQALTEIASLRREFDDQIANLPAPVDGEAIQAAAVSAAAESDALLADRLDALEASMDANSQTEVIARVSQLETRIEGIAAEVQSLNSTLSEAITTGGDMSAETLAQLAAKDAVIEGLRAELSKMSAQIGTLSQRIEEVDEASAERANAALADAQSAEQRAAQLARQTAIAEKLSTLTAAAESGRSFEDELAAFAEIDGMAIPDVVSANAATGLPSIPQLEEAFTEASHQAIRASIKSEAGDGTLSRVSAFFQSQVATRSLQPQEGATTDAVLSRVGSAISSGDLAKVLAEAETLDETASAPLAAVLNKVRLRHNVLTAISSLATNAS